MTHELLLFDLDGTITNPYEGMLNSFVYMMREMNIPVPPAFDVTSWIGPPLRTSLRDNLTLTDEEVEIAVNKFREHQFAGGMFENVPYEGAVDLLARLKNEGHTLAIATSKLTEAAVNIAKHFGFYEYFDFFAGSVPDGSRNSKKTVITFALDNIKNARNMRPLMIGDRSFDSFGARECGIDCVGVLWGFGSPEELRGAGAVRLAACMDELYGVIKG